MPTPTGPELAKRAMEEVPTLSCAEYKDVRDKGLPHVLLDVREKEEFDAGHIAGAVNVPRGLIEFKIEETIPDKTVPVLICCAKGGRAALAAKTLMDIGYGHVRYLEGGYEGYCKEIGTT